MKKINIPVIIALFFLTTLFLFTFLQAAEQINVFFLMGILFSGLFLFITFLLNQKQKIVYLKPEDNQEEEDQNKDLEDLDKNEELHKIKLKDSAEKAVKNILQGISQTTNPIKYAELLLRNLAAEFNGIQGVVFQRKEQNKYIAAGTYAFYSESEIREFTLGEGISGQVAKNQKLLNISNVPENYITVMSGLGSSSPGFLLIFPIIYQGETHGIAEIASFEAFPENIDQIYQAINAPLAEKLIEFTKR